jgi:G3E family GTPase
VHNEVKGADHAACVAEIYETQNGMGNDSVLSKSITQQGCVCCTGKGDLMKILHALMKQRESFDYVLIETTGKD